MSLGLHTVITYMCHEANSKYVWHPEGTALQRWHVCLMAQFLRLRTQRIQQQIWQVLGPWACPNVYMELIKVSYSHRILIKRLFHIKKNYLLVPSIKSYHVNKRWTENIFALTQTFLNSLRRGNDGLCSMQSPASQRQGEQGAPNSGCSEAAPSYQYFYWGSSSMSPSWSQLWQSLRNPGLSLLSILHFKSSVLNSIQKPQIQKLI